MDGSTQRQIILPAQVLRLVVGAVLVQPGKVDGIKNAKSSKMGKKDILKVECPIDALDFDILGFIDHNITVNVIQNRCV